MTPLDEARRALYTAPLGEFVARRKALVSQLKAGGDPAGATLLAASPKPATHAWLVNGLFTRGALDAAFAEGARSRASQAALMRGESEPSAARAAQEAHRAAIAAAVADATSLADGAGVALTPALLARATALAHAVTLRGSFAPYERGCLAGDVELPSLEELASGLVETGSPPAAAPTPAPRVDDAARLSAERLARAAITLQTARDAELHAADALAAATRARELAIGAVEAARVELQSREDEAARRQREVDELTRAARERAHERAAAASEFERLQAARRE